MNSFEINDKRTIKEFRGITFSGYKKSDAKKELTNCLLNSRIEQSCYWSAEFICAGQLLDLWEIILLFMSKHIHLGNPKLALYLQMRFSNFKEIIISKYSGNELHVRNNLKIRRLFAEIMTILCLSTKKHTLNTIKIDKKEFDMSNLANKLKADKVHYANSIFGEGDPKELFIALNELAYNVSSMKNNNVQACYWIEWIISLETICKRDKKEPLKCANRHFIAVENKFKTDIVWMIWQVLLLEATQRGENIKKIIDALLELFTIKYKRGSKRKRKMILYYAVALITEPVNLNIPIYTDCSEIKLMTEKINIIYNQVKANEIKPKTGYLFHSLTSSNRTIETTLKKLDKMSNLMIPRKQS